MIRHTQKRTNIHPMLKRAISDAYNITQCSVILCHLIGIGLAYLFNIVHLCFQTQNTGHTGNETWTRTFVAL